MNTRPSHIVATALLCLASSACSRDKPDFCELLSVSEVTALDLDVASKAMGISGKPVPTRYCYYKNSDDQAVFQISIGPATRNAPYEILHTYLAYMDGENRVIHVSGVGDRAAALFSGDYEHDEFRNLIATNSKWSIEVRASGIASEDSEKFRTLEQLADTALSRF